MCETTFAPGARQAMSAVNTGMPFLFAASIAGPTARLSHGQSTIARMLGRDEVVHLLLLPRRVELAADDDRFVAGLLQLRRDIVADHAEERVGERQHRDADGSLCSPPGAALGG